MEGGNRGPARSDQSMGWMRTIFLGDIGNRLDIEDTESDIKRLRDELRKNRSLDATQGQRIELLECENEQLELLIVALARLLGARGVLHPDELRPFVEAIDDDPAPEGAAGA